MAIKFIDDTYLTAIANAIRSKLGGSATYKPSEMATAIGNIESVTINNQNKTVHPSSSDQTIEADNGYTGLGQVAVKKVVATNLLAQNIVDGITVLIGDEDDADSIAYVQGTASGGITPTGTKQISITSDGTTTEDVTSYASAEITVNVGGGSNHFETGKNLFLACGSAGVVSANPVHQLTGATAPVARRTLYCITGDAPAYCYYTTSGSGPIGGYYLITIPTGVTKVTLKIDKTCQYTLQEYAVSNGSVTSNGSSSAWVDITANTNEVITLKQLVSTATHISFCFRVNSSNTNYSSSNMPQSIKLDFS